MVHTNELELVLLSSLTLQARKKPYNVVIAPSIIFVDWCMGELNKISNILYRSTVKAVRNTINLYV